MSGIRHVAQEHPHGCGIACVAMLTDRTYRDAHKLFDCEHNFMERGITHYEVVEALARCGFATQFIFSKRRAGWPLSPWAPGHIVQVGNHFIVMLAGGGILDPAISVQSNVGRRLDHYEATRIYSIIGVFPSVAAPMMSDASPPLNPAPGGSLASQETT